MNIAYISYEYPPETALGGIATYVMQAANLMVQRGHQVHVFCASHTESSTQLVDNVHVHRIKWLDTKSFHVGVCPIFTLIHAKVLFDIVESPEYSADALTIKQKHPDIPLVVKLHTPNSLVRVLNAHYITLTLKVRFLIGNLLRGRRVKGYWNWTKKEKDNEYLLTRLADQIHAPSVSVSKIVSEKWGIEQNKIRLVPYPFIPSQKFLQIETTSCSEQVFTYVGRLEVRKGLIELVKAAPLIFDALPNAKMKVIGRNLPFNSRRDATMKDFIKRKLRKYLDKIEFLELNMGEIPSALAATNVCIFPSLWENFPNVCLEAMSAGRAIIASKNGGMKEMLEDDSGVLIDPLKPKEIAKAVIELLKNDSLSRRIGENARRKVLTAYNAGVIGELMEKNYEEMVTQRP